MLPCSRIIGLVSCTITVKPSPVTVKPASAAFIVTVYVFSVVTCFNAAGSSSTTLRSNDRVGFSAQSTTNSTVVSPRSRRPLARWPTRITPFRMRLPSRSSFWNEKLREREKNTKMLINMQILAEVKSYQKCNMIFCIKYKAPFE